MDVPFCLPAFSRSCSVAAGAVVVCSGRAGFRLRFSFCFVLFWPYLPTRPVQMVLLLAHEVGSSWSRGWDDAAASLQLRLLPSFLVRLFVCRPFFEGGGGRGGCRLSCCCWVSFLHRTAVTRDSHFFLLLLGTRGTTTHSVALCEAGGVGWRGLRTKKAGAVSAAIVAIVCRRR